MKYTIEGFNQKEMVNIGMDSIDALILRWFVDFKDSGKMAFDINPGSGNGESWYWINYKSLIEDMPILKIRSKEALGHRLLKLVNKGVLKHWHKLNGGSYSMYNLNQDVYLKLISNPSDSKVGTPHIFEYNPSDSKVGTKDSSTNNSSTNNNIVLSSNKLEFKTISRNKSNEEKDMRHSNIINQYYDLYMSRYRNKPGFSGREGALLKKLLKEHDEQIIIEKLKLFYTQKYWFNTGIEARDFVDFYNNFYKIPVEIKEIQANKQINKYYQWQIDELISDCERRRIPKPIEGIDYILRTDDNGSL